MSAKIMPHGWMDKGELCLGRPKMRRFVCFSIGWLVVALVTLLMLWTEGDGRLPRLGAIYWLGLIPGPVLIGLVVYFRLTEQPRGCKSTSVVGGLLMGLAGGLAIYGIVDPRALVLAIICVTALVGFHFVRLNRRLDALIEFLHAGEHANAPQGHEDSAP